ncbi:MAG: membrane protein [Gammaproteobacteria bacterium]|nr:MAG: membrane protein [Gammaproteobacteria bacterium]
MASTDVRRPLAPRARRSLALLLPLAAAPLWPHIPAWLWGVLGGVWLLAWLGAGRPRLLPGATARGLLALLLGGAVWLYNGGSSSREAGVQLLLAMLTLKLLELRHERDGMMLLMLGAFLPLAAGLYEQGVPQLFHLAAVLALYLAVWTGLGGDGPRAEDGRPALRLLLAALPIAVLLFVFFPRLPSPLWGLPERAAARSGLDDTLSPGAVGQVVLDDAPAFRVHFEGRAPLPAQRYWRVYVLWDFDGRDWLNLTSAPRSTTALSGRGRPVYYELFLEPHDRRALPVLDMPAWDERAQAPAGHRVALTTDALLRSAQPVLTMVRYRLGAWLDYRLEAEALAPGVRRRALDLPPGSAPRSTELARRWLAETGGDPAAVLERLLDTYHREFYYTLRPPPPGPDWIDGFLFDTRRGFCEHFAAATAVVMRAAGVPARLVLGYQGGEYNPLGGHWLVRQADAHAWVELWWPGRGWQRVDPTAAVAPERIADGLAAALPAAERPRALRPAPDWLRRLRLAWDALDARWNYFVLGYDRQLQRDFLAGLGWRPAGDGALALAAAAGLAALLGLIAWWWRRAERARPDPARAAWRRLGRALAWLGHPRAPAEGPVAYRARLARAAPALAATIHPLTEDWLVLRYRRAPEAARRRALQRLRRGAWRWWLYAAWRAPWLTLRRAAARRRAKCGSGDPA